MSLKITTANSKIIPESTSGEVYSDRNEKIKKQFKEVSDLYEKQFLREMMKSMRSTVQESGMIKVNQAEKIFREQLDNEYVEKWGEKGGIGISELIYNNMMDRFGARMGLKEKVEKPVGPLQLKEKDTFHIKSSKQPSSSEGVNYLFTDVQSSDATARAVNQPWTGYLTKKMELAPDEYFLEINHVNGLKSQMHFKGKLTETQIGSELPPGHTLGYLSLDSNSFSWTVAPKN